MPYKGRYYVVRNGPEIREDWSNIKFTRTRVINGIDACMQTFGRVTDEMFVKAIGTSKSLLMYFKHRSRFAEDPEGWISMAGVIAEEGEYVDTGSV